MCRQDGRSVKQATVLADCEEEGSLKMAQASDAYHVAEVDMEIPPVPERGRRNENPKGISFWTLVAEDFRTHDRNLFEQGLWAIFVHRFGNWRMGQPKIIRAPATALYWVLYKLVEWSCGISLPYPVKLGRRVRIWHHSGMIFSARAIGDDVQLRQNTTMGIRRTDRPRQLPIICADVDIGAGAVIVGEVVVGRGARIGANAVVTEDVPAGGTAIGNPAQIYTPPVQLDTQSSDHTES
jgi:serine O-acetyltransferase